jgi:T5orf172 domain
MPVYMIQAGEHGPVKIGRSTENGLRDRLFSIQSGNHVRLSVIRVLVGDKDVERALHSLFSHRRMHGEWFEFDEDMLGDLGFPVWADADEALKGWNDIGRHENKSAAISAWMRKSWMDPIARKRRIDSARTTREHMRLKEARRTA